MARTNTLPNFLTDVADAIREKKGTEETIQASDFDTEIASISSGADISEYFNTTISSYNYTGNIFISDLVQKKIPATTIGNNVTTLHGAFYQSRIEELENLTFGNNITDLIAMFSDCPNLKKVNITNGDTSNVTSIWHMFYNDNNLIDVNISNFVTTSLTDAERAFNGCSSLASLDLSNWETPSLTTTTGMFAGCSSLMHLDIRKMTFDNVSNYGYMFASIQQNCEIIVKSQTEKDWVLARRYDLTNVKTVAELE